MGVGGEQESKETFCKHIEPVRVTKHTSPRRTLRSARIQWIKKKKGQAGGRKEEAKQGREGQNERDVFGPSLIHHTEVG